MDVPYGERTYDGPHVTRDDDDVLIVNGVAPDENGDYYRCGFDTKGLPIDTYGNTFYPHAGSSTPTDGRCNETLKRWEERYGSRRYCQQYPKTDSTCCVRHQDQEHMKAKETFKHGLSVDSHKSVYQYLSPMKQVVLWAMFDDLLDESNFAYDPKYDEIAIDCTDGGEGTVSSQEVSEERLREVLPVDDDGCVRIEVPTATDYIDRARSLWLASIDGIKMENVQEVIMEEGMQRENVIDVAETSDGGFVELTEMVEHHLNLPYSRLTRDRRELLEYGGVGVDVASDDAPDQVVEIYDSPLDDEEEAFSFENAPDVHE